MHDNKPLSTSELRKFGLVTGAMIILFIGVLLPWLGHKNILAWQKITLPVGGTFILWALIHAESLVWIHKPWMFVADKIGWVNTRIILAVLFFVIIAPLGVIIKLFGTDPMARKFVKDSSSYRIQKQPQPKDHMETPY